LRVWNRIERHFKQKGLRFLETHLGRRPVRPEALDLLGVRRILVVRQHDQLGDFLLATPALRALRERFPKAYIALVVRRYTAEAALHNRYIDEVIVIRETLHGWKPGELPALWRKLRQGFDLAVVLNTVSHSLTSDLLAHLSGARRVLGSAGRVFPGCRRNFFYNLEAPLVDGRQHQTDRNLDILRYLGIETQDKREVLTLLPEELAPAKAWLREQGIDFQRPVVGLHPGAGKEANRWPADNFAAVARRLHERGIQVLLTWGPKEKTLGQRVLSEMRFQPIVAAGLRLRPLAALLAHVDLFVCNDTGVMHVAAAVGAPTLAIFGPTDPYQWAPLGDHVTALRAQDGRCVSVSVEEVLGKIEQQMERRLGRHRFYSFNFRRASGEQRLTPQGKGSDSYDL